MKPSITQEADYGCGIACFAFACNLTYKDAEQFLGEKQAQSDRFIVKDFVAALNHFGKNYRAHHIKPGQKSHYDEGTIVLVRRSKRYPVGHYLIRHQGYWMDPRINLVSEKNIHKAASGYRKRLPGMAMYALEPVRATA